MAFRAYSKKEIQDAAEAYGVDADLAEAIYAVESSRGTNPKALTTRAVKRKRDTTFVRGPFQLEDDTTADLIRENKLGNVNVDDPDVHLDLAMRQIKKLQDRYNGDEVKIAQAYLGGPGGVGTNTADELGTTTGQYSNKVLAELAKIRGSGNDVAPQYAAAPSANEIDALLMGGNDLPADDAFGIPAMAAPRGLPHSNIERDPLGLPMFIANATRSTNAPMNTDDGDLRRYIESLVDDELRGKDFSAAA